MDRTIQRLLDGYADNHIFPFFWQHGEDEPTLRHYMRIIRQSGCGAVCIESRPHPDFCGPKWWADMDVILDEAKKLGMKVWILDDSHFPTGYANGAVEQAPAELCRQSICCTCVCYSEEAAHIELNTADMIPPQYEPVGFEKLIPAAPVHRHFEDDCILSVVAFNAERADILPLNSQIKNGVLYWDKPPGKWTVWICGLSRNCGPHRNYINMMDHNSCKILLDAVYEPHWAHYQSEFGSCIAGFFSDEPELGNGHLYAKDNPLGTDQDLPFSSELAEHLALRLGDDWADQMFLLWENKADPAVTARVRYVYMDCVSALVGKNFSRQIGDWCHKHGVQYIGHSIEDCGTHARTASGLGHYFRGLSGQNMAGIDDIGGQVYPLGENDNIPDPIGGFRDATFYHFLLGKLGSSAAAIEPRKQGNTMCEIFGNYGWSEGVRLEKYLVDHFLVRGVNYFVPHAFSAKAFPDPDCPPHFYAHGHNPQFRHFSELMGYINRTSTLFSNGHHISHVALLYHAEGEWSGAYMKSDLPARALTERQIDFDLLPCDVFKYPEYFKTRLGSTLAVNTQEYKALIIPYMQFIPSALCSAVCELLHYGMPVFFLDQLPQGECENSGLPDKLRSCPVIPLEALVQQLDLLNIPELSFLPADTYLRAMHYHGENDYYLFTNEGNAPYYGTVAIPRVGDCYYYNAWQNKVEKIDCSVSQDTTVFHVALAPLKSTIVVFDTPNMPLSHPIAPKGVPMLLKTWKRSICESISYPEFLSHKTITLPDQLAAEEPSFSGIIRYETSFSVDGFRRLRLEIEDAAEGVEVFINGQSVGIQISPPFLYEITTLAQVGENNLAIEVATTLERKCHAMGVRPLLDAEYKVPSSSSGITGNVILWIDSENTTQISS